MRKLNLITIILESIVAVLPARAILSNFSYAFKGSTESITFFVAIGILVLAMAPIILLVLADRNEKKNSGKAQMFYLLSTILIWVVVIALGVSIYLLKTSVSDTQPSGSWMNFGLLVVGLAFIIAIVFAVIECIAALLTSISFAIFNKEKQYKENAYIS